MIFFYSAQSSPPIEIGILYLDKLLHLVEYAILGYLAARAAKNSLSLELSAHFRFFAVCISIIYGLTDEYHQYFVSGREADILDALADGFGAYLGQMFLRG